MTRNLSWPLLGALAVLSGAANGEPIFGHFVLTVPVFRLCKCR
jgi:hypothetical protein